jgi:hypothetical protein
VPGFQQLILQAEHLGVFLRLGVIVAEQVKDPMHGQQLELGLGAVPRRPRLRRRYLRA